MLSFLGRPLQGQPRSDALGALASARMGLLDVPRVMGVKMPCIEFARYSHHFNRFSAAAGQDEDPYLTDDQVQLALKREAHTMSGTTKVFIASQDFLWMMCRADSDEHAFVLADVHLAMWGYTMGELDFAVVPAVEDGQGRIAQSSAHRHTGSGRSSIFGGGWRYSATPFATRSHGCTMTALPAGCRAGASLPAFLAWWQPARQPTARWTAPHVVLISWRGQRSTCADPVMMAWGNCHHHWKCGYS